MNQLVCGLRGATLVFFSFFLFFFLPSLLSPISLSLLFFCSFLLRCVFIMVLCVSVREPHCFQLPNASCSFWLQLELDGVLWTGSVAECPLLCLPVPSWPLSSIIVVPFQFYHIFFFFKILFILFLDRGEGREKERERNINVWLFSRAPNWGPGLQSRHVLWLGIEPVTL